MFKLVVLFAVVALVSARPGYLSSLSEHSSSVLHGVSPLDHLAYSSPLVSGYSTSVVSAHAPAVAVVKSLPSAVSHQSSTVVHSKPAVVAVSPLHIDPALHIAPAVSYVKQISPISYSLPIVSDYSNHGLIGDHGLGYATGYAGLAHGW